jgi:hypothetical protein
MEDELLLHIANYLTAIRKYFLFINWLPIKYPDTSISFYQRLVVSLDVWINPENLCQGLFSSLIISWVFYVLFDYSDKSCSLVWGQRAKETFFKNAIIDFLWQSCFGFDFVVDSSEWGGFIVIQSFEFILNKSS